VVSVSSAYIGADSETVEKAVTIPLEEAINGVEGMRYISSSSTNSGFSQISTTFKTRYNLDVAAIDVQNRVTSVQGRVPGEVNATGVSVQNLATTSSSAQASSRWMAAPRASLSPTISTFT
jgi:HAE1 family hydrophobic/amphiphilic exporter-1